MVIKHPIPLKYLEQSERQSVLFLSSALSFNFTQCVPKVWIHRLFPLYEMYYFSFSFQIKDCFEPYNRSNSAYANSAYAWQSPRPSICAFPVISAIKEIISFWSRPLGPPVYLFVLKIFLQLCVLWIDIVSCWVLWVLHCAGNFENSARPQMSHYLFNENAGSLES